MRCSRVYIALIFLFAPWITAGWTTGSVAAPNSTSECSIRGPDPGPPPYYAIDLVTTRKIRGARRASGIANITYAHSPFGVSISRNGNYVYNLSLHLEKLDAQLEGQLVAWVTTTDLKKVKLLGVFDESFQTSGQVDYNKFLVVITLEPEAGELGDGWTGPVVLRGMSRSGFMHTRAGHGPFQIENCASYGYS